MEGIVAIIGAFGGLAFVTWALLQTILRWREISRETQIMTRLVEHVGSAGEAVAFLEAPSARKLFDRMVDRRTLVLQRVLRAVQSGILGIAFGIAMFVLRPHFTGGDFTDEEPLALLVFGTIALALGIAFLVAAGASYALSQRWGLLKES